MAVEFRLLGSVEVRIDGRRVDAGPPLQRSVLVALLVEADEPVSADQLVERVWGDRVPYRAKETLRSYLSRLRPVLAPGNVDIVRRSGGYVLTADPATVDVHRFRELVGQARAAGDPDLASSLFEHALGLWHGEAFAGLDTPWLAGVREGLDAERIAAELDHVDLLLGRGRHGDLLATLAVLTAERPLDERLAGQLMVALYRSGRQADALDHFRRIQRRLGDELGVDPGAPLRELHRRILAADPALTPDRARPVAARRLRQLPGSTPNFVGRTAELDQLTARLDTAGGGSGTVVITSISGLPGIGKTSLAVHWARRHVDRFPDGQLYVNLRGFDPSATPMDPAEAVRGFLDAFEVPAQQVPTELAAQVALYRGLVEDKRMVIVLDNARDTDQVRPLLPGSPSCLVLVTSRHQLSGLVVRDHAQRVTLDTLSGEEARELLADFLGADRVAAEADAVEEIIRRCGYLPLALSIAAARAGADPDLPLSALVEELRRERETLTALSTGDTQDTDLRTVFSWSYRALSQPAARLFRLLGLHPGPDLGALAAACLADLPEYHARALLAELTQLNLLRQHKPGRYQFHDLLRAYAHELAGPDPERTDATRRCLDYYLHATSLAMAEVDPRGGTAVSGIAAAPRHAPAFADRERALQWIDTEYPNLIAATGHAVRHGWYAHAWRLPHLLQYYFDIRSRLHDWISTHQSALTAARHLDDEHAQAEVLKYLGIAFWLAARSDDALEHSRRALALFRLAGDLAGEGDVLNLLGLVYERTGQYEAALDQYQQALPLRLATGNRRGEGATLQNLGNLYDNLGRHEEAVSHYHRALAIFRELGDQRAQAIALGNLGIVLESMGQLDEAADCLRQSCALAEATNDQRVAGNFLTSLGAVYHRLGRPAEAIEHHRRALRLIRDVGERATESAVLNNLGVVHLATGQDEQAVGYHQQALSLARDGAYRQEEANAHHGIGNALLATDPDGAREHWRQALAIYDQLGVPKADEVRRQLTAVSAP
ncbi:tetratricopeptide repeat protein [Actinophytocola sp.]|uniref:AfsR/SARP family transcriptional regulator n=1 Tax=Actinophytocola sp. TaxID=1872138 RepID=UPI00389A7A39